MIIGKTNLDKRLDAMSKLRLGTAIGKGIVFVQEAAKDRCPAHDGELRESIYIDVEESGDSVTGICFTNKEHGPYVEFGTGPKGQANHEGISPDVTVAYSQSPWWIHEGPGENEIDRATAEYYHFFYVDTPQGRFYQCTGQAAQPFLYPALKDNEEEVSNIIARELKKQL